MYLTNNSKKLTIDWNFDKKDYNKIDLIAKFYKKNWENNEISKQAELKINTLKRLKKTTFKKTYHPIGTIKIGSSIYNSVLNKNLKLWNVKNLYVCSTAVFPSSGSSNTGFCLLALAARLSIHIKNQIKHNTP